MVKKMNLNCLFGCLKGSNRVCSLLCICLLFSSHQNGHRNSISIFHRDILGDSIITKNKNKLVITVLKEPACTGCKIELLKYMKQNKNKVNQLFLPDWIGDIVVMKNYRNYVSSLYAILIWFIHWIVIRFISWSRIKTYILRKCNRLTQYG